MPSRAFKKAALGAQHYGTAANGRSTPPPRPFRAALRADVLVNNGGVSTRCLARDAGFALDQRLATVDYLSHVCLAKAVLPAMIGRQKGHFINISSVAGVEAPPPPVGR